VCSLPDVLRNNRRLVLLGSRQCNHQKIRLNVQPRNQHNNLTVILLVNRQDFRRCSHLKILRCNQVLNPHLLLQRSRLQNRLDSQRHSLQDSQQHSLQDSLLGNLHRSLLGSLLRNQQEGRHDNLHLNLREYRHFNLLDVPPGNQPHSRLVSLHASPLCSHHDYQLPNLLVCQLCCRQDSQL
jgi:hypothetical protein